ncbi:hypothetical protein Desal_2488 [Maridesulfovibrio salexigens DSM 2638]|uniref:Uncharacterized protein n=1 Tax=Maridesulfovibrio salexigens (strain ATCC 14822 / DSM 2638 / NCIMB 8403 / VKM B-1763) TaxID=526222 RepID=C6BY14_MARSD|nr:hypothetical protein Desal_2488 [Maridesulfovibrio salexigens DSM 2638]
MEFAIITIVLICYVAVLLFYTVRSNKEIICSNCGHKYLATPRRSLANMYLLLALGLAIVVAFFDFDDFIFSILLAIAGLYYLLKEEGYKCYNCNTINQLPK